MNKETELQELWMEIHALEYNARIAAEEGDDEAAIEMLEQAEQKKREYRDLEHSAIVENQNDMKEADTNAD